MRVVAGQFEVPVLELEQRIDPAADVQPRQRPWRARELLTGLIEMVQIQVRVAQRVHELTRRQASGRTDMWG